ncbi:MAG: hypothetical protein LC624_08140 [Halobacteriales archaeon]|nr:hypothetical protein [Halobacteriales archaeon]
MVDLLLAAVAALVPAAAGYVIARRLRLPTENDAASEARQEPGFAARTDAAWRAFWPAREEIPDDAVGDEPLHAPARSAEARRPFRGSRAPIEEPQRPEPAGPRPR